MLKDKFTRQQVIWLTGIKTGSLSYLDRQKIVCPEKIGNPKHPIVLYSFENLVLIAAIVEMKNLGLSLTEIRKVLELNQLVGFRIDLTGDFAKQLISKNQNFYSASSVNSTSGTKYLPASI